VNTKSLLSAFLTAILIGGLVLASALRFGTVQASTDVSGIPKPSVPEFTLSYVVRPYDIGPSYTIDPYTGENITLLPEIHTTTAWVLITVKNQPFSPYTDADGNYIELWYNVSLKGHFGHTWGHYPNSRALDLYNASAETVIDIPLGEWPELGPNSQLDFRLEALIGHFNYDRLGAITGFSTYEASGWSNTQTITVYPSSSSPTPTPSPATTPTPDQTPTPTPSQEPQQTEQIEPIVGAAIVVAVIIAVLGLLIYLIKRK
jgi:hypothetical protein